MNIFVSNPCPFKSAIILDDLRLNKMILESAQLLSNVAGGPYKPTHVNHPCAKWVATSTENFIWLYNHFRALGDEYEGRKKKPHKCLSQEFLDRFEGYIAFLSEKDRWLQNDLLPQLKPSRFVNCASCFKHLEDVHEAYRKCLEKKWANDKRPPKWAGKEEFPGWP